MSKRVGLLVGLVALVLFGWFAAHLMRREPPAATPKSDSISRGPDLARAEGPVSVGPAAERAQALSNPNTTSHASTEPPVEGPPQRWIVRGTLQGPVPRDLELAGFLVRQRNGSEWITPGVRLPQTIEPGAVYRIDVTELFRDRPQQPEELEVTASHPRFAACKAAIDVKRGRHARGTDGVVELVFLADIAVPSTAVITGRVFAPIGDPSLMCYLSVHRLREGGVPTKPDDEVTELSEGEFRLRVIQAGPVVLLARTDASRPVTIPIEAVLGEERSVGNIQLDLGARVCGRIENSGGSVSSVFVVGTVRGHASARPQELVWNGNRYRRVCATTRTDSDGGFCLTGFEVGDEVELPPAGCSELVQVRIPTCAGRDDERVSAIAPAEGLLLELDCSSLELGIEAIEDSTARVPFVVTFPNGTIEGTTWEPGKLGIGGCPGTAVHIEIHLPGYQPWSGDFSLPEAGTTLLSSLRLKR